MGTSASSLLSSKRKSQKPGFHSYESSLYSDSQYYGETLGGWRHGQGVYLYPNGDVYAGEWRRGVREGWGIFVVASEGAKYEGCWKNGVRHGLGVFTFGRFSDATLAGSKFFGFFQDDRMHGRGLCFAKQGGVLSQSWEYGKIVRSEISQNFPTKDTTTGLSPEPPGLDDPRVIVEEFIRAIGNKNNFHVHEKLIHLVHRMLRRLHVRELLSRVHAAAAPRPGGESELLNLERDVKLVRKIASGGFGAVYRGRWRHLDVAVKLFAKNSAETAGELHALRTMRHPNIVMLLGVLEKGLIFEYVPCGSLFDLLHKHKQKISINRAVHLLKDVAAALAYMHELGFWHCDVKSGNVLLTATWRAKLADLGLACDHLAVDKADNGGVPGYGSQQAEGLSLGIVGTFHWTAPEVLRGEDFSAEADVYSLGCVLWEAVTCRIPHSQFTALQTLALVGYGNRRLDPINEPKNLAALLDQVTALAAPQRPPVAQVAARLAKMANVHLEDSLERFFTFSPQ